MLSFGLCMIVKNEEAVLDRCLLSTGKNIFDEIIIADTGSCDRTKKIAEKYTDKIYDYPWKDDFADARNFAFSKCTSDYMMWLDADDVLTAQTREALLRLKQRLSETASELLPDVIMMKYDVAFDEKDNVTFSYYRERLLKRSAGFFWEGPVHEVITPRGKIIYEPTSIQHRKIKAKDSSRNLRIYESMQKNGGILSPRHQFYYGRELYDHQRYAEALEQFEAFLNRPDGFVVNKIDACRLSCVCCTRLSDNDRALSFLLKSLSYDVPGAEVCCDIGDWFYRAKKFKQAVYWYTAALSSEKDAASGKFIYEDCYGYHPNLGLCLCYDALGEHKTAAAFNEAAGKIKPYGRAYLWNREYFGRIL